MAGVIVEILPKGSYEDVCDFLTVEIAEYLIFDFRALGAACYIVKSKQLTIIVSQLTEGEY